MREKSFSGEKKDDEEMFILRRPLQPSLSFTTLPSTSIQTPDERLIYYAAEKLGVPIEKLAMIGDKIWTDIIGAKKAGALAIFIQEGLHLEKDPLITKPTYFLQSLLMGLYKAVDYEIPQITKQTQKN